jgi:hypothetical protein
MGKDEWKIGGDRDKRRGGWGWVLLLKRNLKSLKNLSKQVVLTGFACYT